MQYSNYQQTIFETIKKTRSNIAVRATAGSGKTTTIVAGLRYIPSNEKSIFLSFSNAIVNELKTRVPPHVDASTLHSRGFKYLINYYRGRKIVVQDGEQNHKYLIKALDLYKEARGLGKFAMLEKKDYRAAILVEQMVNFARMTLIDYKDNTAMMQMCLHYNIDIDKEALKFAQQLMKKSLVVPKTGTIYIDFIDMTYFPAMVPDMVIVKYDNICLDEAQDTNQCQFKLIENMLKPSTGRLISVGDDMQCIYGFGGADIDSFKRIREREGTITLPLSVSYRCPKNVVARVKADCPAANIETWEGAEDGEEREGVWDEIEEGDMILSRTTAPLIGLYFRLIENNIKARIIGKDIETGLMTLIDSCMSDTFNGMKYNIELRFAELRQDLEKNGVKKYMEHHRWRTLEERQQVIEMLSKKVKKPSELQDLVKNIFSADKKAAQLMTIHRSKGLEAQRVFLIVKVDEKALMPNAWAKQNWEFTQEDNLLFVALTRSKNKLIFISLTDIA